MLWRAARPHICATVAPAVVAAKKKHVMNQTLVESVYIPYGCDDKKGDEDIRVEVFQFIIALSQETRAFMN